MNEKTLLNSPLRVVAIDPGRSGAVALLGRGIFEVRRDFTTNRDIADAIRELSPRADCGVIEGVHAFPGQGVTSVWSFGRASGVADAALYLSLPIGAPIYEVFPARWQNMVRALAGWEGAFDSRQIATKLCPWFSTRLTRKKDHGSADAILLAVWRLMQPGNFDTRTHQSKFSLPSHRRARRIPRKESILDTGASP